MEKIQKNPILSHFNEGFIDEVFYCLPQIPLDTQWLAEWLHLLEKRRSNRSAIHCAEGSMNIKNNSSSAISTIPGKELLQIDYGFSETIFF